MTEHWTTSELPGLAAALVYLIALAGVAWLTARGPRRTRRPHRKAAP